jgi:sec-independent protein translocase protein TatA
LILAVVVLLFGAKKLPELARGSGRALRIFKAETKGLIDDDERDERVEPKAITPSEAAPSPAPTVEPERRTDTTD